MFGLYMRFEARHTPPWSRIVLNPVSLLGRFCVNAGRLIFFGVPVEREPTARLETRDLDFELSVVGGVA